MGAVKNLIMSDLVELSEEGKVCFKEEGEGSLGKDLYE